MNVKDTGPATPYSTMSGFYHSVIFLEESVFSDILFLTQLSSWSHGSWKKQQVLELRND
jgi:hypothetical protein